MNTNKHECKRIAPYRRAKGTATINLTTEKLCSFLCALIDGPLKY
jgi:hypothetical protein